MSRMSGDDFRDKQPKTVNYRNYSVIDIKNDSQSLPFSQSGTQRISAVITTGELTDDKIPRQQSFGLPHVSIYEDAQNDRASQKHTDSFKVDQILS
jgi:hypothetical protein